MLSSIATTTRGRNRTAVFLLALLTVASASHAAEPDYSGVKDILRGRRTLFAINDLVIGGTVLKTSQGTKIDDKNISELPGFQRNKLNAEILARLFDSKSGDLVNAYGKTIYARDPISRNTTSIGLNDDFSFAGMASGDFRGDGVQEVVIASFSGVRVVSAVDPNHFSKGIQSGPQWKSPQA